MALAQFSKYKRCTSRLESQSILYNPKIQVGRPSRQKRDNLSRRDPAHHIALVALPYRWWVPGDAVRCT